MKKKIVSLAMATAALAGMSRAQTADDIEQYKQDIKKKFDIAVKQQQSEFERFNKERVAQFNDFVNRAIPAKNAKDNNALKKQINQEFAKQMRVKGNWTSAELMPAMEMEPMGLPRDSIVKEQDGEYIEDAMPALKPEKKIPYPVIKNKTDFKDGALYYEMMQDPELEKNTKLSPKQRAEYNTFKQAVIEHRNAWNQRRANGYSPTDAIIRAKNTREND